MGSRSFEGVKHLPASHVQPNDASRYSRRLGGLDPATRQEDPPGPVPEWCRTLIGYDLPAAIAAKLEYPDRTVVCLAGDGCFQMTLNELSTAVQHGANIVVIVANNGLYGTIRMHQEMHYPGRMSGTDMFNPDYSRLAKAYGCHGETVSSIAEFAVAFEQSIAADTPALIELRLDPDAISTDMTITKPRKARTEAG